MSDETILECCAIVRETPLASAWPLRCTRDRLTPGLQELHRTVDAFVRGIEGLARSTQLNAGDRVEPAKRSRDHRRPRHRAERGLRAMPPACRFSHARTGGRRTRSPRRGAPARSPPHGVTPPLAPRTAPGPRRGGRDPHGPPGGRPARRPSATVRPGSASRGQSARHRPSAAPVPDRQARPRGVGCLPSGVPARLLRRAAAGRCRQGPFPHRAINTSARPGHFLQGDPRTRPPMSVPASAAAGPAGRR